MITLAVLAIFSGLSLNLLLTFALGTARTANRNYSNDRRAMSDQGIPLFQFGILFTSVLLLWTIFYYLFPFFLGGFFEYFLLFPFSALACMGLESISEIIILKRTAGIKEATPSEVFKKTYSAITAYEGLVPLSLFITLHLAWNFIGAFVLALFFALGNIIAILILNEIRRKAGLEKVPRILRGNPLVFITMGLLSFAFMSLAGVCYKIMEYF